MEKTIAELEKLLLANTDITRYGDGYKKAMTQAIDVCNKCNINTQNLVFQKELLLKFSKYILTNYFTQMAIDNIVNTFL